MPSPRFAVSLFAALFSAFAISAAGVRAQTTVTSERPATFTLPNGLQVVVIPDHRTPVVTQMIWYKVGSADETPGKSGLAHFLEHLMFKGTSKHPAGEFSQTVLRVGGDENALQQARPVLEPMAGKIIHCGAAGAGQAAKVCNNMVLAVQQIAIGEAFVLAEKLGLSAQSLFDVITGATGNCWAVHTNCPVPGPVPTSPANNDFKPGFATALMNKELGLAMDAVAATSSAAPLGSHAAEIYAKFAADHADKDFSAVIEDLRGN